MSVAPHIIAIVGAGFSGTMTAVHLLRRAVSPMRIYLIDREGAFGRGVAYARHEFPYLLNVPAGRMSAFQDAPDDFLQYLRELDPAVVAGDFVPRAHYGDYLEQHLQRAESDAPSGVTLERVHGAVTAFSAGHPLHQLHLDGGDLVDAHAVVLATGHPLGTRVDGSGDGSRAFLNPWTSEAADLRGGPLLILGTGLTAVDWICAYTSAHPAHIVHVLSRHGLLPIEHTQAGSGAVAAPAFEAALGLPATLRELVRLVRGQAKRTVASGGDWRDTIAQVRHRVPDLWGRMSEADRRRFLRHVRAYWDVHRHRVPAAVGAQVDALRRAGRVVVHAGRLRAVSGGPGAWTLTYQPRTTHERRDLRVAHVVSCAGTDYDLARSADPLWSGLLRAGVASQDAVRTGIRADDEQHLIPRAGAPVSGLYYVGPLLRAGSWEATAVPELRGRTLALARRLILDGQGRAQHTTTSGT